MATMKEWVAGLCQLAAWVLNNRGSEGAAILSEAVSIPGDARFYLDAMRLLQGSSDASRLTPWLTPSVADSAVVALLQSEFTEGHLSTSDFHLVRLLPAAMPKASWAPLVAVIEVAVGAVNETHAPIGHTGVQMLLALRSADGVARASLSRMASNGSVAHWLSTSDSDAGVTKARIAYALVRGIADSQGEVGSGNQDRNREMLLTAVREPGDEVVQEFASLLETYGALDSFLALCQGSGQASPFPSAVLKAIMETDDPFSLVTPALIVARDEALYHALGQDEYYRLISRAVREGGLREYVVGREFDTQSADLYQEILEVDGAPAEEQYREFVTSGLRTVAATEWATALTDMNNTARLVVSAVGKGIRLDLSTSFFDGVLAYTDKVLEGHAPSEDALRDFATVLSALRSDHRQTVLEQAIERLVRHDGPPDGFLALYGSMLLEQPRLLLRRADDLVDEVFRRLLESSEPDSLAWMAEVVCATPRLFSARSKGIKERFGDRLREARKVMPEKSAAHIDRIVAALHLQLADRDEDGPPPDNSPAGNGVSAQEQT